MRVSVVVTVANDSNSLDVVLRALRWQRFRDFEVVIVVAHAVNADAQAFVDVAGLVKVVRGTTKNDCLEDLGATVAAGDLLAFIDSETVPDFAWLEQLVGVALGAPTSGIETAEFPLEWRFQDADSSVGAGVLESAPTSFVRFVTKASTHERLRIVWFDDDASDNPDVSDRAALAADAGHEVRLFSPSTGEASVRWASTHWVHVVHTDESANATLRTALIGELDRIRSWFEADVVLDELSQFDELLDICRPSKAIESFAQNFEDLVLWRALGHVPNGTFVDVGAAHPEWDSVTNLFALRGWTGLNVEPVEELAEYIRSERPHDVTVTVAAGERDHETTIFHVEGTGLSTLSADALDSLSAEFTVEPQAVSVRTLRRILTDAGFDGREVHFLKVDVEMHERQVLEGADFATWRPWVVLVEATKPQSTETNYRDWEHLFTSSGYQFVLFDGLNRFYVALEHPELVEALSYPICVFDQPFETASQARIRRELERMTVRLLEAGRELARVIEDRDAQVHSLASVLQARETQIDSMTQELERLERSCVDTASTMERASLAAEERITLAETSAMANAHETRCAVEALDQVVKQQSELLERLAASEALRFSMMESKSWRLTRLLRRMWQSWR